jgi:hypothetical protein
MQWRLPAAGQSERIRRVRVDADERVEPGSDREACAFKISGAPGK